MDAWTIILCLLSFFVALFFGWFSHPFNRVKIYRMVYPKRNWRIIQLVLPGGQVRHRCVSTKMPSVVVEGFTFPLKDSVTANEKCNYLGSIPYQTFSTEDTAPIVLSARPLAKGDAYRSPGHLTSFLMLMKAYYEALASRQQELIKWLCIVCIAVAVVGLFMSYQNGQAIAALSAQVKAGAAASQALSNQLVG